MNKMICRVDKQNALVAVRVSTSAVLVDALRLSTLRFLPLLLLSACAATPETHFYVLSALNPPSLSDTATAPKRLIGLGPVTVPALLERKQLVTRIGDNSITSSEFHQWAAPLQEAITETLAQNLSALLPNGIVKAYPWSAYGEMDSHIIIDIARFETNASRHAELIADWTVMDDKTHRPVKHGQARITRPQTGSTPAEAVKALSETLQEFSRQLADALPKGD